MAKHIRVQTKRKLKLSGIIGIIFTGALILNFVSSVFLRTSNQQLSNKIQNVESEIVQVKGENDSLTADIHALRDTSRVVAIAKDAGLETTEHTVTIKKGE